MNSCLTRQLLNSEVSGCLLENPECGYACQLGFSFLCRHPDHSKFNALVAGLLTKDEVDEIYEQLRQKRRHTFLMNQEQAVRNYLCRQTDFFGQPLKTEREQEQQVWT